LKVTIFGTYRSTVKNVKFCERCTLISPNSENIKNQKPKKLSLDHEGTTQQNTRRNSSVTTALARHIIAALLKMICASK